MKLLDDQRTIAGWKDIGDQTVWSLTGVKPGKYEIHATWSLVGDQTAARQDRPVLEIDGKPIADSDDASSGDSPRSTGGWDKFASFKLGQVELTAGKHQVTFRPSGTLGSEWIRLRRLKLVPIAKANEEPDAHLD